MNDWNDLQAAWRADGLAGKVRGSRRGAWFATIAEVIFALVSISGAVFLAVRAGERWTQLWALFIVVLFAVALGYALWNRRDALWPSSAAPLDFLAETELRCRRRLELLRFMLRLGFVEAVISIGIFCVAGPVLLGVSLLALVCAGGYLWIRLARARALRELAGIARLRKELEGI
jgi:hypothetical protein